MSQTVQIESATKIYDGKVYAVNKVDLHVREGEFFTLLGPSGCGKTTLLRMIAGFNTIDEGRILFGGQVINDIPAHRRNIGMVFQNYAIFPHMNVWENIAYGLRARKIKGSELNRRVDEALELMAISEYRDRQPAKLSGGQQQRVALARAIVIHPAVLLMDEPLSNLDAKLRVQMRSSIKKLQMSLNTTTLYVTHDQEEALAISDRIAVMNNGRVEQIGEPEEIYMFPANTFVANFIGTSCFIDGAARQGTVTMLGRKTLSLPISKSFEGEASVAVRPEGMTLSAVAPGELTGKVSMVTFLGGYISYEVQLDDGPLAEVSDATGDVARFQIGDKVSVLLNPDRINVFSRETGKTLMVRGGETNRKKGAC